MIYLAKKKKELVSLIPFKDAMVANATKEFFGPCPLSFSGRQGFNAPFILLYKYLFHCFGSQPCVYVRPFVTTKVDVRALEGLNFKVIHNFLLLTYPTKNKI